MTDDQLRGTGRTTRMIKEAKRLADEGRSVYIIVDSKSQQQDFRSLIGDDHRGIHVEVPTGLNNFDWESLRLRGAHPNCVVLVDHYVIERRFAAILKMLHRFDLDPVGGARPEVAPRDLN